MLKKILRLFKEKTGAKDCNGKNIRVGDKLISKYDDIEDGDTDIYTIYKSGIYPGAYWLTHYSKERCDNYGCGDYEELLGYADVKDYVIIK